MIDLGINKDVDPKLLDWVWLGFGVLVTVFTVVQAIASFTTLLADGGRMQAAWPIRTLGGVALSVLTVSWLGMGSWRRTVWGCRVNTGGQPCYRHTYRCGQFQKSSAADVPEAS